MTEVMPLFRLLVPRMNDQSLFLSSYMDLAGH